MTSLPRRAAIVSAALVAILNHARGQDPTTRASVDSNGVEGDDDSGQYSPPAISGDGRFVTFESYATDLVSSDANGFQDIFVHDRVTGATVRVSVDSAGVEANGPSQYPSISSDGRFVAFESDASNLVANDTNGTFDVFVHDRDPDGNGSYDEGNGVTLRASVSSSGAEGNSNSQQAFLSPDGSLVVFQSYASNLVSRDQNSAQDVFLHVFATGATVRVSVDSGGAEANGGSYSGPTSIDGQIVSFFSAATNLVSGDSNGAVDVFVRDRIAKSTTRVSVDSSGAQADGPSQTPDLSLDGSRVTFMSSADNLVPGDTNRQMDIFVRDRSAGTTTRASVDSSGGEADDSSWNASISGDGGLVAYWSFADDLVANDTNQLPDVFAHDLATGQTALASPPCTTGFADGASFNPSLSSDGSLVAFASWAKDLIPGDTNDRTDVFSFDRTASEKKASWSNYGSGFPGTLGIPTITASANPVLGATITVDLSNSYGRWTPGLLLVGLVQDSMPTSAGGTLLLDPLLVTIESLPLFGLSIPVTIPNDPQLCGVSAFLQALEADPGAQHGISFTPGLELDFGQ